MSNEDEYRKVEIEKSNYFSPLLDKFPIFLKFADGVWQRVEESHSQNQIKKSKISAKNDKTSKIIEMQKKYNIETKIIEPNGNNYDDKKQNQSEKTELKTKQKKMSKIDKTIEFACSFDDGKVNKKSKDKEKEIIDLYMQVLNDEDEE